MKNSSDKPTGRDGMRIDGIERQLFQTQSHTPLDSGLGIDLWHPQDFAARAPYPADMGLRSGMNEYWSAFRRHGKAVLLIATLCALAGFILTLRQKPVYQAHLSLEIQGFNNEFLNVRNIDPTDPAASLSTESNVETQIKILQSESMIDRVVSRLNLHRNPEFAYRPGLFTHWLETLHLTLAGPISPRERTRKQLQANLSVGSSRLNRIVDVLYDSPDPNLAADVINTLADEFIQRDADVRWNAAKRTGEWLNRYLEDIRVKLQQSEEKLLGYARASGLIFTSEKDSVAEAKLRQLQEELSRSQADRVAKQSRYELAASNPVESLPAALENSVLRDYQVKLTNLRQELAELRPSFKETHYRVRSVQSQIEEVQAALAKERENVLNRIRTDFESALRREKLLAADYATQAVLVSNQTEKAIQYNILKQEVDSNRQLYEAMLQKVKEAGIASATRASNIHVVDPASPPSVPYKPNPLRNAELGLLTGLSLGIVLVFARERAAHVRISTDLSIRAPSQSPSYLRVPELGVIPLSVLESGKFSDAGNSLVSKARNGTLNGASNSSVELASWQNRSSSLAESFRATATSVLFCGQNGKASRVIVVTSPAPGEGKTTAVTNLGIALAEVFSHVLLIDGDTRRPRLHQLFEVDNERGLRDLICEKNGSGEYPLDSLVQPTKIPNLFVLPSSSGAAHVWNLLHSSRAEELLQRFRLEFNVVLIDTPPVMQAPDARVLARQADGVILVFRAGQTTREAALAVRQRFAEDGSSVLGTILNAWTPG